MFGEPTEDDEKCNGVLKFIDLDTGACYTVYGSGHYDDETGRTFSDCCWRSETPYRFHVGCRHDVDLVSFLAWLNSRVNPDSKESAA